MATTSEVEELVSSGSPVGEMIAASRGPS
jgi:hypothetical protein